MCAPRHTHTIILSLLYFSKRRDRKNGSIDCAIFKKKYYRYRDILWCLPTFIQAIPHNIDYFGKFGFSLIVCHLM